MRAPGHILARLGAVALLVVGAVHVQQYVDILKDVPTINVLFLLNGAGAGVLCVMLLTRTAPLAALGGIGLSAGALVSIMIARYAAGGIFAYREPTFRTPMVIAIVAEAVVVVLLSAYLARLASARRGAAPGGAA